MSQQQAEPGTGGSSIKEALASWNDIARRLRGGDQGALVPVVIPRDAVAHIDPALGDAALQMMEQNMRAEIVTAADCLP